MRLYTWTNQYLSSIQKGIQTTHLVSDLFIKYTHPEAAALHIHPALVPRAKASLLDWALNHKTVIVLNGGNCAGLRSVCAVLNTEMNPCPWTSFHEDKDSLNSAHTVTGVVLSSPIYDRPQRRNFDKKSEYNREFQSWKDYHDLNPFELEMISLLDRSELAI